MNELLSVCINPHKIAPFQGTELKKNLWKTFAADADPGFLNRGALVECLDDK